MKNILLIDDDLFMRDIVGTKLADSKYAVCSAATAEEGSVCIEKEMPDLILLDMELPDRHGTEILKELKENEKTKNIPVIIFTNNDDKDLKSKCMDMGASDFFLKVSIDVDELRKHIEKILG